MLVPAQSPHQLLAGPFEAGQPRFRLRLLTHGDPPAAPAAGGGRRGSVSRQHRRPLAEPSLRFTQPGPKRWHGSPHAGGAAAAPAGPGCGRRLPAPAPGSRLPARRADGGHVLPSAGKGSPSREEQEPSGTAARRGGPGRCGAEGARAAPQPLRTGRLQPPAGTALPHPTAKTAGAGQGPAVHPGSHQVLSPAAPRVQELTSRVQPSPCETSPSRCYMSEFVNCTQKVKHHLSDLSYQVPRDKVWQILGIHFRTRARETISYALTQRSMRKGAER